MQINHNKRKIHNQKTKRKIFKRKLRHNDLFSNSPSFSTLKSGTEKSWRQILEHMNWHRDFRHKFREEKSRPERRKGRLDRETDLPDFLSWRMGESGSLWERGYFPINLSLFFFPLLSLSACFGDFLCICFFGFLVFD